MIKVRLDIIGQPENINLFHFIDNNHNTIGKCQLFVNVNLTEADYWLVSDNCNDKSACYVNPEKIFFLTSEIIYPIGYYDSKQSYIAQFGKVFSCYDIYADNVEYTLPFLPWLIKSGYHDNIFDIENLRNTIAEFNLKKSNVLSVLCSAKSGNEHHNLRLKFVTKLKDHFKDKIDWFGSGVNPVGRKWDAIAPYKYHLALENRSFWNIISEKLYDSFLGLSYPIYYGAPNVLDYFPEGSLAQINISDFKHSVNTIDEVISKNTYEDNTESLLACRELILGKFNVFNRMASIIERDAADNAYQHSKRLVTLRSQEHFSETEKAFRKRSIFERVVKKLGYNKM
jgi:hypothetical protein